MSSTPQKKKTKQQLQSVDPSFQLRAFTAWHEGIGESWKGLHCWILGPMKILSMTGVLQPFQLCHTPELNQWVASFKYEYIHQLSSLIVSCLWCKTGVSRYGSSKCITQRVHSLAVWWQIWRVHCYFQPQTWYLALLTGFPVCVCVCASVLKHHYYQLHRFFSYNLGLWEWSCKEKNATKQTLYQGQITQILSCIWSLILTYRQLTPKCQRSNLQNRNRYVEVQPWDR